MLDVVHTLVKNHTTYIRAREDLRMPLTWFLNKKDGYLPYFAKSSRKCTCMVSCKKHNENVYIQNAKGTFQKHLFQTKILFEKHAGGRVGLGRECTQETD